MLCNLYAVKLSMAQQPDLDSKQLKVTVPDLVIKYAQKVDDWVGARELIIKRKPKGVER